MKTKIVDIHCDIERCQLVTSTVIAVGLPCDPIVLFTHSPRGEHPPFEGGPCRGSGLQVKLVDADTIRSVCVLGFVGPLPGTTERVAIIKVDRDPPVAKAGARRQRDETHHDDEDGEHDLEDEIAHPRE